MGCCLRVSWNSIFREWIIVIVLVRIVSVLVLRVTHSSNNIDPKLECLKHGASSFFTHIIVMSRCYWLLCGFPCGDSGTKSTYVFLFHHHLGQHYPTELSAVMDMFYNGCGH